MRQAGVIAAAGLVALQDMVDRLEEDHENAQILAAGLAKIKGIEVDLEKVDTNMVIIDTRPLGIKAEDFANRLSERNVKVSIYGMNTIRFVTNKDVSSDDVLLAVKAVEKLVLNLI